MNILIILHSKKIKWKANENHKSPVTQKETSAMSQNRIGKPAQTHKIFFVYIYEEYKQL